MIWSDKYCIGVDEVDAQHEELFNKANSFIYAVKHNHGNSEIGNMLKILINYTNVHFESEEELMGKIQYPKLPDHHKLHKDLVNDIVNILKKIKNGERYNAIELIRFLEDWLSHHILQDDMKIGKYIKSSGISIN